MLSALPDAGHPDDFTRSDLFRKCREMGIIPRSEADLDELQGAGISAPPASAASGVHVGRSASQDGNRLDLAMAVDGMWCPACAWLIESVLRKVKGIMTVACDFATDRIVLTYDPVAAGPKQIMEAIGDLGYGAHLPDQTVDVRHRKGELLRLVISAGLTLNVMMLSLALYGGFFTPYDSTDTRFLSWLTFAMTTIVLTYGGNRIFRKAIAGIAHGAFGMETLVGIGALSAYSYSIASLTVGSLHIYFDTAAMLVTLVLFGKMLESKAKRSVQADLGQFLSLQPTKVRVPAAEHPAGRYVSLGQLRPGDVFQVEPSETVPADGEVTEGTGHVDESTLSGEAQPREKKPGDALVSGTQVIQGSFRVKATRVGDISVLGQMIRIMERTLATRSPLEEKTDHILRWFVPAIVLLAAGTGLSCRGMGLSWEVALVRTITVLVVACPCALGIAIPMARIAGVTLAYRSGTLVRDFRAFSEASRIGAFVFDKTGTLTRGEWELLEVIPVGQLTERQVCSLALAMEQGSDHPIAAAVRRYAPDVRIHPLARDSIKFHGNGITADMDEGLVKIGSRAFLSAEIDASGVATDIPDPSGGQVQSTVYMSIDGNICAHILFGDRLKPEARAVIAHLADIGIPVSVISGDSLETTRAAGRLVGCSDATGGLLPVEKAGRIEQLQRKRIRVAMAGDGINDAPALARADLSIAVPGITGSHLSREAADITLMRSELDAIPTFLDLGKAVSRKIHQNLAWAFAYNIVSVPVAMAGLLTPLVAVSAMLLSSLSVIANSLLLLRCSPGSGGGGIVSPAQRRSTDPGDVETKH